MRPPRSLLLVPLLLPLAALAHEPHDGTAWVAVSPGPDPEWLVVMLSEEPKDSTLLIRSRNRRDVEVRHLLGRQGAVPTAVMLGPRRLALGTTGLGLWTSDDLGDSFTVHPDISAEAKIECMAVDPDVLETGLALAVGTSPETGEAAGRVWRTDDAGTTWEGVATLTGVDLVEVVLAPDFSASGRAFVRGREGRMYRTEDHGRTWTWVGQAEETAYSMAVGAEGRVWLGSATSGLLRSDDDGASFTPVGFEEDAVVAVGDFGGGLVMVAQPERGVWVSTDDGDTWTLEDEGLDPVETDQPRDGIHFFRFTRGGDGAIYLASWEGAAWTRDQGATWETLDACAPEITRGLAFTRGTRGDLAVLASVYGGGLELVDAAAEEARPLGSTLLGAFPKRLAAVADWAAEGVAFVNLLRLVEWTPAGDGGWTPWSDQTMGDVWDVAVTPSWVEGGFVLAAGNVEDEGGWCFQAVGEEPACQVPDLRADYCSAVRLSPRFAEDHRAWVACGDEGQVWVTRDRAASWAPAAAAGHPVWGLAADPTGEILYLATHGGLAVLEGGSLALTAFTGRSVWAVESAGDHVFALVAGDRWYRGSPGGTDWVPLDQPTLAPALTLALSPDYATDQTLAVGTFDGTWLSRDAGTTWTPIHALETLDDSHPAWTWTPGWTTEADEGSTYGRRTVAQAPGVGASLAFRGVGLDLITQGDVGYTLTLDGAAVAGPELRELEDTWHTLEVRAEGPSLVVDGARVWRRPWYPGALDDTGVDDTDDDTAADTGEPGGDGCGRCQSGAASGGSLAWAALGLAALRRRRRE